MLKKTDIITEQLRTKILRGVFEKEKQFPSQRILANHFHTTQETINKVMQRLQAEGLLYSLGKQGVFIQTPRARISGLLPRFDTYLQAQGLTTTETNIELPSIVPAAKEIANRMKIKEGTFVVRRWRKQGTLSTHYRLTENFYPLSLVKGEIFEKMKKYERFDVVVAIKDMHGKIITHVHEDVIARLPTKNEQDLLEIVSNTPVLEVLRSNYEEDKSSVIMVNRIIFVANYFVLSYDYPVSHWSKKIKYETAPSRAEGIENKDNDHT